jgi:Protein of unknown function (DUF1573)
MIMKKVFSIFMALFMYTASFAQLTAVAKKVEPVVPTKAVIAEVLGLKETEYDFGKIPQGKPVTHNFEVLNFGSTGFKLENVTASCGCTTPDWNKEETIMPGKSSFINVGFNAGAEGPFAKQITINYNGGQNKIITIKGEVWKTPTTSAPINENILELK